MSDQNEKRVKESTKKWKERIGGRRIRGIVIEDSEE
jgi:hypothetical protein